MMQDGRPCAVGAQTGPYFVDAKYEFVTGTIAGHTHLKDAVATARAVIGTRLVMHGRSGQDSRIGTCLESWVWIKSGPQGKSPVWHSMTDQHGSDEIEWPK